MVTLPNLRRRQSNARWASAVALLTAVAVGSGMWAELKKKQVRGWILRVFDTFELLDAMATLEVSPDGVASDPPLVCAVGDALRATLASDAASDTVSVEAVQANPFVKQCADAGLDLCMLCEEVRHGDGIRLPNLVMVASMLNLLAAQPASTTDEAAQRLMFQLMLQEDPSAEAAATLAPRGATAGSVGGTTGEGGADGDGAASSETGGDADAAAPTVSAAVLQEWLLAAAMLGVVRCREFQIGGGLLRPPQVVEASRSAKEVGMAS